MKKIEYDGNKNIIHSRLKVARRQMGISQSELAARMQVRNVNLDQQMISRIERNLRIVTDYEFASFCAVLKVDGGFLLEDYHDSRAE